MPGNSQFDSHPHEIDVKLPLTGLVLMEQLVFNFGQYQAPQFPAYHPYEDEVRLRHSASHVPRNAMQRRQYLQVQPVNGDDLDEHQHQHQHQQQPEPEPEPEHQLGPAADSDLSEFADPAPLSPALATTTAQSVSRPSTTAQHESRLRLLKTLRAECLVLLSQFAGTEQPRVSMSTAKHKQFRRKAYDFKVHAKNFLVCYEPHGLKETLMSLQASISHMAHVSSVIGDDKVMSSTAADDSPHLAFRSIIGYWRSTTKHPRSSPQPSSS